MPNRKGCLRVKVRVPSGSRAVGETVGYAMEADFMEAYTTSVEMNSIFLWKYFASVEVAGRFHGIYCSLPWKSI